MMRTFAVSDIHGCAKTLKKLLLEEVKIEKGDTIYFLGDYIDRGPDSKGVIDFILELKETSLNVFTLRGNHEQLFIDSEKNIRAFSDWIANSGAATLDSFDVFGYEDLEERYKSFFSETKFYFETDEFIFVHAGLNFSRENIFEDEFSMLWTREMRINKKKLGNKIIIHGHTPTILPQVKSNLLLIHKTQFIDIDTGCFMKKYFGFGYLSALEVETMHLYSIKNID